MRQAWRGEERRKHWRYPCVGQALIVGPGAEVSPQGQLSDVSLGGCYIDMMYPLPSETEIELTLIVDQFGVRARGRVCASRQGFGMGVCFKELSGEDRVVLESLIGWLAASLPQGPQGGKDTQELENDGQHVGSGTVGVGSDREMLDALVALLGLLERKGVISPKERADVARKIATDR